MKIEFLYTCLAVVVGTVVGMTAFGRRDDSVRAINHKPLNEPYLEKKKHALVDQKDHEIYGEKKDFVGRGKKYIADFGDNAYEMFYHVSNKLTYRELHGLDNPRTVEIDVIKLRDNLFLINWQQEDSTIVSQIVDFDYKTIYSVILSPDKELTKLNGSLRVIS